MTTSYARRAFVRGSFNGPPARRPPWTADDFTDACTRCNSCISACPDQLLFRGDGGFPEIDFSTDGCNFCGKCAQACTEPVFDLARVAFSWKIALESTCLALGDTDCRSCEDACEPRAITFRPTLGRVSQPELELDACNGCGACLAVCPVDAIRLEAADV